MLVHYWPQNLVGVTLAAVLTFTLRDLWLTRSIESFRERKRRNLMEAQRAYDDSIAMTPSHWRHTHVASMVMIVMLVLATFGVLYAGGFWDAIR